MAAVCVEECLEEMEENEEKPFITRRGTRSMYNKVCILVIVNVVLSMSLVAVVLHWREIRYDATAPKEQELCVPVASFDVPLDFDPEEKGLTEKIELTGQLLCGKTSVILSFLIKKAIKDWDEVYESGDLQVAPEGCTTVEHDTPSGHVHGINFEEMNNAEDGVIHWKSAKLSLKGGIGHENGRFLVKDSGYYYVSSQVKFSDTSSSQSDNLHVVHSDDDNGTFIHSIYKQSTGVESAEKLLEAAKTLCESVVETSEATSITGSVFYLQEGDEVYVGTSNQDKLIASDESNHFSLYRI